MEKHSFDQLASDKTGKILAKACRQLKPLQFQFVFEEVYNDLGKGFLGVKAESGLMRTPLRLVCETASLMASNSPM